MYIFNILETNYLLKQFKPKYFVVYVGTPNNICTITPNVNMNIVESSNGNPVKNVIKNAATIVIK